MTADSSYRWARACNLILPGGGLIVVGAVWTGLTIGMLFALGANFAVAATFLIPDEVPAWVRAAAVAFTIAAYAFAQWRLPHAWRRLSREARAERRRAVLHRVRVLMEQARFDAARDDLASIADLADHDLLVAVRIAEVETALRAAAAREACGGSRALTLTTSTAHSATR
ncbi:MAG: hypothetical protein AB7Q17_15085, partial [Phycisphaerae bacterium]